VSKIGAGIEPTPLGGCQTDRWALAFQEKVMWAFALQKKVIEVDVSP
jgi:hypothetical protein